MIDSNFMIRYTNGLYATSPALSPTYAEFRDMFSSGQLRSKEWAVEELLKLKFIKAQSVIIVGAWFGTLGLMLKKEIPGIDLTLLDIDPRCEAFLNNIGSYTVTDYENIRNFTAVTQDMYDHKYVEDIVINTACEHILDVSAWLKMLPKNTLVLLQSNNYFTASDHVNCVSSIEAFKEQTDLSEILYAGELPTNMYTRYMIIGRV